MTSSMKNLQLCALAALTLISCVQGGLRNREACSTSLAILISSASGIPADTEPGKS